MNDFLAVAIFTLTSTFAGSAHGGDWRLNVGLGYGERTNPLIQSKNLPVLIDVDIAWFGDHFFFDNGDFGLTLLNNNTASASLVARAASDRVFFSKFNAPFISIGGAASVPDETEQSTDEPPRPPDRDYAIEVGLEVMTDVAAGTLTTAFYHDIGHTHEGWQMLAEYDTGWRTGRWYFSSAVGLTYNSASRNDYFWGVAATEASSGLPAHEAESGVNFHVTLGASYHFTKQLSVAASISHEQLSREIRNSPLVNATGVTGYFGGMVYRF